MLAALAAASSDGLTKSDLVSIIVFAVIAVFSSITAPLVISARNTRLQSRENLRVEKLRKAEKEEDWARQDRVAARAADAAERLTRTQADAIARQDEVAAKAQQAATALAEAQAATTAQNAQAASRLAAAQAATTARTDEVARLAALDASRVQAKLDRMEAVGLTTHALVNSDMTEARESELTAARALLAVLERIVGARESGRTPDPSDVTAIDEARMRIRSLEALIADRKAAQSTIADATAAIAVAEHEGDPPHDDPLP